MYNVWIHPDTLPFGEHFWVKSKLAAFWASPHIFTVHESIWKAFPNILDNYNEEDFCTGAYGNTLEGLSALNLSYARIFDSDPYFVEETYYDGSNFWYTFFMVLFGIGCL